MVDAAVTQIGSTIRSIAAARHIRTAQRRTGLGERRGETPWAIDRQVPGNRLAGREAICQAIEIAAVPVPGTGLAGGQASATRRGGPALATEPAGVERTV